MFGVVVIATGMKSNLITTTSVLFSLEEITGTYNKANFLAGAIIFFSNGTRKSGVSLETRK